jgi:hypothetical protein
LALPLPVEAQFADVKGGVALNSAASGGEKAQQLASM